MALTTIGLSNLTFGTSDFNSAVVRSFEQTIKCDPVELMGGSGTFKAVAISNPNTSISMTIVSGSATGGMGDLVSAVANTFLTGGQASLYIESSSRTFTNDGFAEVQLSASGWANLGQTS
jgi:hypothetical protein